MNKFQLLMIFIFLSFFQSFSEPLIDEEIYFDAEENNIIGKKKYIYNAKQDITAIYTYNKKKLESKFEYIYSNGILLVCEEYTGETTRIKYSIFEYNNNDLLTKKIEYDMDENVVLIHDFEYDKKGFLRSIKDSNANGQYLGEKRFIYIKDEVLGKYKLVEEKLYDDKQRLFIKKIYDYNKNMIIKVSFFTGKDLKIRAVKRNYSNMDGVNSVLGYRENFYDYR